MTDAELLAVIEKAAREEVTSLDLSEKNIKTIRSEIAQLTNLQTLDLSHNQISVIPDAIANKLSILLSKQVVYLVLM